MRRGPSAPSLLLLAVLLAGSISAKLVLGGTPDHRVAEEAERARVAAVMAAQGFRIARAEDPDSPFVGVERGDCRALVAAVAPQGWHRDILRRLARPGDRVAFLVGGEVLDDQPVWRTFRDYYWRRLNRFLGREVAGGSVHGVLATPGCDLTAPGWIDLAK